MNEYNDKGQRHGYWEYDTIKINYSNGHRHGTIESYWNEEKTMLFFKGNYNMNKETGYWKEWCSNGELRIKEFYL